MVKEALAEAEVPHERAVRALEEDLLAFARAVPLRLWSSGCRWTTMALPTLLMQLATISAPEPRLLTIRPFDPGEPEDHRARHPGLRPGTDPEQRRQAHPPEHPAADRGAAARIGQGGTQPGGGSRVAVRNVRRDVQNDLREFESEKVISEDELQRGETSCRR